MKTREELNAYNREWWAAYRKTEKYQEKLALKRERDRRYRERMAQERKAEYLAAMRAWRVENRPAISDYLHQRREPRAQQKRTKRAELPDWYIKEQLGLRNPPQSLIEAKRLHKRIKKLIEDANEQHRKTA